MQVISARQAAELINDGDFLAVSGFMVSGLPEYLMQALEERWLESGHPKSITAMASGGLGNWDSMGMQHIAHEGLLKRIIEGHMGACPSIGTMILANQVEAYNLPIGIINMIFRNILAGKKGEMTKVGLKTYLDPRVEGGKMNSRTTEDMIRLVEFDGEEYLYYPSQKIDVAFVRGTTADEYGNITFEDEPVPLDTALVAMATRNCGGKVVAQVRNLAKFGSLPANQVKIPGNFIDYVVLSENVEVTHRQTCDYFDSPALTGVIRVAEQDADTIPLDERKVIARRCSQELTRCAVVNLGIGMPEGISQVAAEEKIADRILLTSESGLYGGTILGGHSFGAGMNNWAIIDSPTQFDFYHGGGLDIAFLGLAQADSKGNINVSKFGSKVTGSGGFINITQCARKVVFCGTMTTGGLKCRVEDGHMIIEQEGRNKKFIRQVGQITFSGEYANEIGQEVLYVTERCVFRLTDTGLELIEVAPGIDVEKHILSQMEFTPQVAKTLRQMDTALFLPAPIGLKAIIEAMPRRYGDFL